MANLRTNNLSGEQGQNAYRGSVFFDGTDDYLSFADSSDFVLGTGDFTVEAWFLVSTNLDYRSLIDTRTSVNDDWMIGMRSNDRIYVYAGSFLLESSTGAVTPGHWHHVAYVRSSGTHALYLNGVSVATSSTSKDYDSQKLGISVPPYNLGAEEFSGYVSNVRIVKGTALYTGTFTPPRSELTAVDGTVVLCCQDSDDPTQEATGKTIDGFGAHQRADDVELITNGTFGDTTGWTAVGGATLSVSGGQLVITGDGGAGGGAAASFTTVIGKKYILKYDVANGTISAGQIRIGTAANGYEVTYDNNVSEDVNVDIIFTATSTTTYITLGLNAGIASSGSFKYDNVSVTLIDGSSGSPKVIPPYGVDAGNTFGGPIQQSSQGYMYFPTGRTEERGRGRALIAGGSTPSVTTNIDFLNIQSSGRSTTFGNLSHGRYDMSGCASSSRAVFAGGRDPAGNELDDTIDFVTIATTANATDFGNLTASRGGTQGAVSSSTRGIWGGGFEPSQVNKIEFVTIASAANATDFGDLTVARNGCGRAMSPTRGLFGGGGTPSAVNTIDFITMASTGNAQDFGDTTATVANSVQGTSSNTRGIFGGLGPNFDTIDFVTIASTGNATDFGDLVVDAQQRTATGNTIRGIFAGGYISPTGRSTIIDQIEIATTGSASSFGDLLTTTSFAGSTSDSHGGLS